MKRVTLDTAEPAVKEFIRDLPMDANGVEIELDGKVVCEILPPHSLSAAERAVLIARGRQLLKKAQSHQKTVPPRDVERFVRDAVDEVRGRHGK